MKRTANYPDSNDLDDAKRLANYIADKLRNNTILWAEAAQRAQYIISRRLRYSVARIQEIDATGRGEFLDRERALQEWFAERSGKYPKYPPVGPTQKYDYPNYAAFSHNLRSLFLGTIHRANHPANKHVRSAIVAWLHRTAGRKRVVLIEGPVGRTEEYGYKTVGDASKHGEIPMADYLAKKYGVERVSLMEDPTKEVEALLARGIPPDMLFFHNIIREIPVAIRKGLDVEDYAMKFVDEYKFILNWGTNEDISTDDAVRQFNRTLMELYGSTGSLTSPGFKQGGYRDPVIYPFGVEDDRWIRREQSDVLLHPNLGEHSTPLEQVSLEVHRRREEYAIESLRSYLDAGYDCLTVFGQFHMPYILERIPQFSDCDVVSLVSPVSPGKKRIPDEYWF